MRKVAVIGSSGAIGRAFVDHYINDLSINSIFSFSRSSIGIDNNKVKHFSIDIENESSIENAAKSCLLYTSPSPRDLSTSRMPSSA